MVSSKLYPFSGKRFPVQGHQLHYLDEGEGEPVVMIHGNPTWSFYYRNAVLRLRDQFRCLVPDHIGCGLSDKPSDADYEYTLEQRVKDLEAWIDHLNLEEPFNLIVHDWGGMIGMTYATRHPEKIKRLVVLNTGAFHLPEAKALPLSLKLARTPLVGDVLMRGFNAFSKGAMKYCVVKKHLTREEKEGYLHPYSSWKSRIAVHRFVQDIPIKPADKGYEIITEVEGNLELLQSVPMLICWGEKDFVFDHHFLKQWEQYFPDADVCRYPDAGHLVLEDEEQDAVDRIRGFLSQ